MPQHEDMGVRFDSFLASALRDQDPGCEARTLPVVALVEAAVGQGIAPLLHDHLDRRDAWSLWPAGLEEALQKNVILTALVVERRRQELSKVLGSLRSAGIDALLMKGMPLAYTHYPRPELRPSLDTDLLFPKDHRKGLESVLKDLGYEFMGEGRIAESFRKRDVSGSWHDLDCHWAISGITVAARDFPFQELSARSVGVPALGPAARALGPVDALLLCGIHFAHHFGRERLSWLYDVRLLAQRMDDETLERFVLLAKAKRVSAACARVLELTGERLGPAVPSSTIDWLRGGPSWLMRIREPSAAYLPGGFPVIFVVLAMIRNLERWEDARQILLPSGDQTEFPLANARVVLSRLSKGLARYGSRSWPFRRGLPVV